MRGKKVVSLLLILLMMVSASALMTSCGSKEKAPASLEEYVKASESAGEELDKIGESIENELMDGSMSVEGNDIIITIKYKETYDKEYLDSMKESVDSRMDELSTTFDSAVADLEKESGVKGISLKLIIQNGDGTEIFSSDI